MRLKLLFLAFLLISSHAKSQTIHLVYFSDTYASGDVGIGCSVDARNIEMFSDRLSDALGYELKRYSFVGKDFNGSNFDILDRKIQSTKDDIIIFYTSSHGARSLYDKSKYPQVKIKTDYKSVYAKYDILRKLPHKTMLTIIDACNVVRDITPKELKLFSKTYEQPDFSAQISNVEKVNTKNIFLENSFDLIITSSQIGVVSLSSKDGSIFTNGFISSFNYYLRNDKTNLSDIKNVLLRAKNDTKNESERIYINNQKKGEVLSAEEKPHYPEWDLDYRGTKYFKKDVQSDEFHINYTVEKLTTRRERRQYNTRLDYRVVMTIDCDSALLEKITQVKYILHHTFPEPEVIATDKPNHYKYVLFVWGEFLLRAEVTLMDGTMVDLAKDLILD